MSFGKMNTPVEIMKRVIETDDEGIKKERMKTVASVRAYREGRHGSEKWANRTAFSTATDLFRFRCIPNTDVTTDMLILCDNRKFGITSVENVKGRNMYIEALAKEVKPSG